MPTTTVTVQCYLGTTGLAGTAGLVVYPVPYNSTPFLAHTTSGIAELGTSGNYEKQITVNLDTQYSALWDNGSGRFAPAIPILAATGVNVTTVGGSVVRNASGVAQAVATGSITLDAADPALTANLNGWRVQIISATTGSGQVATVQSSASGVQTLTANWPITPTGTVVYLLLPPPGSITVADPLLSAVPGSYSAGQAGYVLGHKIAATIASGDNADKAGYSTNLTNLTLNQGTVSNVGTPSTTTFTATGSGLVALAHAYENGMAVHFETGAMAGLKRLVSSHSVAGPNHTFVTVAFPQAPGVTDTFSVI